MLILGLVSLALSRSLPSISPEAGAIFLEAGMENIGALVEELGLRTKAIYLPSSRSGSGKPQALLPISPKVDIDGLNQTPAQRLIVRYGQNDESVGLLLSTPGSVSNDLLDGDIATGVEGIEAAATHILIGILDAIGSISVSQSADDRFSVSIKDSRLKHSNAIVYQWIGTPLCSIVASIVAEATDRPVTILEESANKGQISILLGVL
ncbi:hypothetical protein ACFLXN_01995 [Chloroflexota bacterium]